jgi:hypothetical protein
MDPQATWQQLIDAFVVRDWHQVQESAEALLDWLRREGFPPETITGRCMGADWNRHVTLAACEFAADLAKRVLTDPNGIPQGVPFTLSCCFCDSEAPATFAAAVEAGWTQIEFVPDGLAENFVGLCPEHSDHDDRHASNKAL